MMGLTATQAKCLDAIKAHMMTHSGVAPSYDELIVVLDRRSKSSVQRLLRMLKERGHIDWVPNKARSIRVLDGQASSFSLPPAVYTKLISWCERKGELPADVIADAVALHLDEMEAEEHD